MGLGTGPLLVGPLSEVHGTLPDFLPLWRMLISFLRPKPCILGVVDRVLYLLVAGSIRSEYRCALPLPFTAPMTLPDCRSPSLAVLIFFRFVTGLCGAAFLSVTGGTISDLFTSSEIGKWVTFSSNRWLQTGPWWQEADFLVFLFSSSPMAIYSMAPFLGPVLGPLAAGFINQVSRFSV